MTRQIFLVVLVVLLSSCVSIRSIRYRIYPVNPFDDIKKVAIFPIENQTDVEIDTDLFANIFASEMVKFKGFQPIRASLLKGVIHNQIRNLHDLRDVASRLNADAILLLTITDYDPYFPPMISVTVRMFRLKYKRLTSEDIDRITRSATWRGLGYPQEMANYTVCLFESTYDSHKDDIRDEIEGYASAQKQDDYAFNEPAGAFIFLKERFWQFVSCQIIHTIINSCEKDN
jgi:hypothetical protein